MRDVRILLVGALALASLVSAKEGMWTPDQLPQIAEDLRDTGLELDPATLTDLTAFPMGAVISLGGCTASFVSPNGLVVTNHHCARGSIQFNSTSEQNYLADGFLAGDQQAELPAAPGTRVYVTVAVADVTDRVRRDLTADMDGQQVYAAIDAREKELVAQCEQQTGHRCQVASFYGGLQYKLIDRLEIQDVRLVYAPSDNVGRYGGDIDNWMWPRHTGDFSFYRAYVGPDGVPAESSQDNVPFQPKHFLKVSSAGLDQGDFVMLAGYPGSTQRYARLVEVKNTFAWRYPTFIKMLQGWITTIERAAPEGTEARIKYESLLAGLNNAMKNFGGQIEGARRVGLVDRRRAREAALNKWVEAEADDAGYAQTLARLDALSEESAQVVRANWHYNNVKRATLLSTAQRLYRLARERQKPDAERESGFQQRDMAFFRQRLQVLERRFDPVVDKAVWMYFLELYLNAPESSHVAALDKALGVPDAWNAAAMAKILDGFYADTELGDMDYRLALMDKDTAWFESSDDPFIQLAVALYDHEMALEQATKDRAGRMQVLRPDYMKAIIAWQKDQGFAAYPDANGTLRVTYGTVMGGSPRDGLAYLPFTTLAGITEKHTGEPPFDAPKRQLELIRAQDYSPYALESIGSVPVNFLSDLDTTGGNSGSATLNARGELVGLLFDGTIESVNSDWDFDPRTTRSIQVDTRYMLWVMDKLDGASALLEEMEIVR